jgi:hypothetical protein
MPIVPWAPSLATTMLPTVWPATTFMFDASGRAAPDGKTVR